MLNISKCSADYFVNFLEVFVSDPEECQPANEESYSESNSVLVHVLFTGLQVIIFRIK